MQMILSMSTAKLTELATLTDKMNEIKTVFLYAKFLPRDSIQEEDNSEISRMQNQLENLTLQLS